MRQETIPKRGILYIVVPLGSYNGILCKCSGMGCLSGNRCDRHCKSRSVKSAVVIVKKESRSEYVPVIVTTLDDGLDWLIIPHMHRWIPMEV